MSVRIFTKRLLSEPRVRQMATIASSSIPHIERTAHEPRDDVRLSKIDQVNDNIRLFRLTPVENEKASMKFLPGQWLDVYVPGVPKAGGFTITSPPSLLRSSSANSNPYVELAIQRSPSNPPAAWLWRPPENILNSELHVRIGGSFTWPPTKRVKRVVFVAGGVGINPLMSMLSSIVRGDSGGDSDKVEVRFLYSTKGVESGEILFLQRVRECIRVLEERGRLELYLTSGDVTGGEQGSLDVKRRRIQKEDLLRALGEVEERTNTACYICGVPSMTDEFVGAAQNADGMDMRNVYFEKWW